MNKSCQLWAYKELMGTKNSVTDCKLDSVANAAVYPLNWATLKPPAAGQKIVGRAA